MAFVASLAAAHKGRRMSSVSKKVVWQVVAWMVMIASQVTAQSPAGLPQEKVKKIEAAAAALMAKEGIPGMSVAVVADKKLVWAKGFGMADLENNVPAKATTNYRLASISKTISATAILQLVERGKLDLDAPVQQYCAVYPKKEWTVTTRQLLGHLGGVRHYEKKDFPENTRHFDTIADGLTFFKDDPLTHEPGTKYQYSSYGYNLIGCVLEGAAGMSFLNYVRENIFKPAGMLTIREDNVRAIVPNRAQGYQKSRSGELLNSELADTSYKIPGGGFTSTVEDLAKFAIALQSGTLLKLETLNLAWTKQKTKDGKETTYGLGFAVSEYKGMKEVGHGGNQARVTTYLYMIPDRGVAVVVMMNLESAGGRVELVRQIAEIVMQ